MNSEVLWSTYGVSMMNSNGLGSRVRHAKNLVDLHANVFICHVYSLVGYKECQCRLYGEL